MRFPIVLFVSFGAVARAAVSDIPSVFGPIASFNPNQYDISPYIKSRPSDFVHPGMWHTKADLDHIKASVLGGKEPWASTFKNFTSDKYSKADYVMQGPKAVLSRGVVSNYSSFAGDARAAWQNAIMWWITNDKAHYSRATSIIDAWGSNLTNIIGTDRSLMIGLDGDMIVNAAEILRWSGNWTETGAAWQGGAGFSNVLYWLFSRQSVVVGQANYGMVSIKAMLNFAVYLDDVSLYNYAVNELLNNPCAGIAAQYHTKTGQSVEAGRDQSHTQSGIGWTAQAMRTIQSQGGDIYGLNNNLLLKAAEYAAQFNLNGTVTYDPDWFRCEAILVGGPWAKASTNKFGITNTIPIWDHLYYQYVKKRGLKAPWVEKARKAEGFEGARGTTSLNDHPSWGGLIWAY